MMTLIAEDLLLLLLDDESGKVAGSDTAGLALGGAVLAELAILGAVSVDEQTSRFRSPKVRVTGPAPEDRVLADALDVVAEKERPAQSLVERLGKGLVQTLGDRLADRGILERRESRMLGMLPRTRWPAVNSNHEAEVRRTLTSVLVQGTTPDPRTGALVAVLAAVDRVHKVVDHDGMSRREVKRRAAEIAEGAWAASGVRSAIQASHAAVTAAVAAAAAAGAAG
ncbi:MAG: GPP34 family phosphoprotein [Nocardioides sp.]|nr:GPP34 family phosphoprotein [Nocardioides sp.]